MRWNQITSSLVKPLRADWTAQHTDNRGYHKASLLVATEEGPVKLFLSAMGCPSATRRDRTRDWWC
jgi:hypothetical protein